MEIILVNYPYGDFEVGEVIDLGEKKNESMVSKGRAVWFEEVEKPKKKITKGVVTKKGGKKKSKKKGVKTTDTSSASKPKASKEGASKKKEEGFWGRM